MSSFLILQAACGAYRTITSVNAVVAGRHRQEQSIHLQEPTPAGVVGSILMRWSLTCSVGNVSCAMSNSSTAHTLNPIQVDSHSSPARHTKLPAGDQDQLSKLPAV